MALNTIATNATATATIIDSLRWDQVDVYASLPAAAATNSSAKWAVLQLSAGDTTAISQATAIVGLIGTTNTTAATNQFVIVAHNDTSNPQITRLSCDKRYTPQRYLFLTWQAPASHVTVHAEAILSRGKISADNDSERGVAVTGRQYVG